MPLNEQDLFIQGCAVINNEIYAVGGYDNISNTYLRR